jgi:hypothetical protein
MIAWNCRQKSIAGSLSYFSAFPDPLVGLESPLLFESGPIWDVWLPTVTSFHVRGRAQPHHLFTELLSMNSARENNYTREILG